MLSRISERYIHSRLSRQMPDLLSSIFVAELINPKPLLVARLSPDIRHPGYR
ncbi:hypothetical protein [Iningainema tapete]|uniref:Uncharacterized protein n=1 Tax=Iningainema tapete BLCC-T55 TaxID=2748662 RepID=A0A8J7CFF4_9CYAN|nr:hypothetical protein [Iningainema tapete]MBD2774810.1 hypothetical protein [Iningainema tapete BLCC-T55]